ncbi:MAG: alkaline phosphatase [Pseudomonadota bacterium]|nr:alkaline phosphatase [Pseudomonadota bacterium]
MPTRLACPACLATILLAGCAGIPATPSAVPLVEVPQVDHPEGETAQWWFRNGAAQAAARGATDGRAKNVILFVGDGMSLPTVAAARILDGQRKGGPGEGNLLAWEQFPATALSRTYNTDAQTPDSAGTMTAMATGVKSRYGVISVGPQVPRYDCEAGGAAHLLTLWELAASTGLATGVVTTTKVTHATPAATFAHAADRGWENDAAMARVAGTGACIDIARQMVGSPFGTGPDVLLGGGRSYLLPDTQQDPEYPDKHGARADGRDLVAEWQARHPSGSVAWNAAQLADAPASGPLLGLFEPLTMHYAHDRGSDGAGEPTLAQMTREAIARLQQDPDGYVLMVEGALIDYAHHDGNAFRALDETIALSEAVAVADAMTSERDTLIVVTADHAHTLSFVGYPVRGNPILGKVVARGRDGTETLARDPDGLPYTTLAYANGPGHVEGKRPDLTDVDTTDPDYLQEAMIPRNGESHGGSDVGIWARGPGSAAVRGSVEQNTIFHFMLQATPRLREALCAQGYCDANGVPVELPDPARFR